MQDQKAGLLKLPRILIQSSKFRSVGYSPPDLILELEFDGHRDSGGSVVWQFYGVPPHIPLEFMMASSKGKYYTQSIYGRWKARLVAADEQIFSSPQ